MMTASDIRKDARTHLSGKWGTGALIFLGYFIFEFLVGLVTGFIIGIFGEDSLLASLTDLAYYIISIPISFGLIISFIKLKRGENVSMFDFITLGFNKFALAWKVGFRMFLKMLVPIVVLVVSFLVMTFGFATLSTIDNSVLGITLIFAGFILFFIDFIWLAIKSYALSLSYFIAHDEPELSGKSIVEKSISLMKGNKGNYFVLSLSFVGWAILSCFTFGIGLFWLYPYMQVAIVCFYDHITGKNETIQENVQNNA